MKQILVTNIEWDTDGIDIEELDLPTEVTITNPSVEMIEEVEEDGYCDEITDFLSDEYGWLVAGYSVEIVAA